MISINPLEKTERENYKILTGTIISRPIAFVTSMAADGTLNGAPFSYFNVVSSNPPLISLAIQRKSGKQKDTARNILGNVEFVVHLVDEDNLSKVNQTAATLPAHTSEVSLAGMTPVNSEKVSVPGVLESKVRYECVLEKHLSLSNNGVVHTDLIIGKVVRYHVDEAIYVDGYILNEKMGAVSRLAGNNYATLGELVSLERPK